MPYKNRICLTLFHRLPSFIENNSAVFTFFRARFFFFSICHLFESSYINHLHHCFCGYVQAVIGNETPRIA